MAIGFIRSTPVNIPLPIGNLINDSFSGAALSSNWTATNPNTTITVSGGDLLLNRSVGGGYQLNSDYLLYTGYGGTCLEDWTITVPFKITETSATSTGFAIGVKSTANWYSNYWYLVQFNTNSGAGNKKLYFYMAGATTATTISSTALTAALNDECTLTVTRSADTTNGQKITATVTNLTNPNSVSHSYTFTEAYQITVGSPPTCYFAIFPFVGQITLHSFTVSTAYYKNCNIITRGDSITRGVYALSYTNRWTTLFFGSSLKKNYSCGGPGDRTTSVLDNIPELLLFKPKFVVLMIGGNDLAGGVAIGTVQTNYQSIVTQLIAGGITVWHCMTPPRNGYDYTTWNSWLSSTYLNVVNTFTNLKAAVGTGLNAAYNSGDGTHENTAGHALIASDCTSSIGSLV